ncbi:MAG: cytochrome c3 family protein, partial [Acidobacteriota bacterium]
MLKILSILLFVILAVALVQAAAVQEPDSVYVGSGMCLGCHSEEFNAWKASRHAREFENETERNSDWKESCAGCHSTGMTDRESAWMETGVGCEACHGPGGEHVWKMGDKSIIVSTVSADVCGRCHGGNPSGGGLMKDGTPWIVGYRPGMNLADVPDLEMPLLDPDALPPPPVNNHPLIYNAWKASGHSRTSGQTFTIGDKEWTGPVTCVACHNPHSSDHAHQLVAQPGTLCDGCHIQSAVLKGSGAKGIEQTRSLHTAISCVECHMTEKNHLMRILRPDDPNLSPERTDTCSSCHEVKDREVRAHQLQDWEAWYRETLEPVQTLMQAVDEILEKNPDRLSADLEK